MTFLSLPFFCFFPVTALGYFLLPRKVRNLWLLLASWFFYLCAKPVYLTLLLFVILTSYGAGIALGRDPKRRVLVLCLLIDIVLLFLFKYVNFALSLAAGVLQGAGISWTAPVLDLVLPVGISFYLFQAMGYVMDVWRGKAEVQRNFLLHALFLSFFPQVVSGPIGRAAELTPQFRQPHPFDWDRFRQGLVRFLWGAFKKMVLADRLAVLVNTIFDAPESFGAVQVMGAAVAFSLQIYCDFSSYTDMALGVAHSMGFTLRENFDTPYFSRSIAEFWRRWHMSLSNWFRDYLYIPLGGSRRGTARKYLSQFSHIYDDGMGVFSYRDFPYYGFDNIRWRALDACCVSKKEEVIFDPLHLKERSKEFEEKKIDWYLKLKVAVAISDATTDVEIKE